MRKLLLAFSILLLASCTEKENELAESETKIETSTNEQQAEQGQQVQQEEPSIVPNELYNKQLSNVIGELAHKFGFLPNGHVFYDHLHSFGLVYAELFDANGDGQDELYVLFKSSSYIISDLSHRMHTRYIQEIWQANRDGDAATLLHYNLVGEDPALNGQTAVLLKSGLDDHEFIIDLETAPQSLIGVMDQLSNPMNSYITKSHTIENEIVTQADNVIQDLKMFGRVDTRDRNTYEHLATGLILYRFVESDAPMYSYFSGYKLETINAELQKRFNITLTAEDIQLPEPSEDDATHFFTYRDGIFYIPPSGHYPDSVFRKLEHIIKVSDDVYYARINEIRFDMMSYMAGYGESTFTPEQIINTPIENWPEEAKPYLIQSLPLYAVVKFVDGDARLLYQGFVNLTDEELASF